MLVVTTASAQDSNVEGSETFHLFKPVPRARMRDFTPDRPGANENPFTVDAGHYHLEIGIASLALDETDAVRTTELAFAETKLRAGLLAWLELQLVIEPYSRSEVERSSGDGDSEAVVDEGYGGTTLRLKLNLWGNDGAEPTALGLLPFLRLADDAVDFGLAVPLALELPLELALAATIEADFVELEGGDRGVELGAAVGLGREIVGPLGGSVELIAVYTAHDANESELALEAGLALALLADVQLDLSARVGLAGPVADIQLFAGAAGRL
jgi:hypothetical protein